MANNIPIEITINNSTRKYKSREDLIKFAETERSAWSWLQEASSQNFLKELFSNLYAKPLKNLTNDINNPNQENFSLGGKDWTYISSDSLEGKLIAQIKSDHGDTTAGFALYFLSNDKKNINTYNTGHLGRALADTTFLRDRELASFIAFSNSELSGIKPRAGSETVTHLINKLQKETNEALELITQEEQRFKEQNKQFENERNQLLQNHSKRFSRRSKAYRQFSTKTKDAAAECLKKAKADLDAAKTAYHDQVDLEASVSYWDARRTAHKTAKNWWLGGVALSMAMTLLLLFTYYAVDGISGAKDYLSSHSQSTETPDKTKNRGSLIQSDHTSKELESQYVTRIVADMAGAALLIALFSTLIRVGLRQFNTHSHLEIDSTEKVTLTKTYLALLNEGKLNSDDDRRLVLEGIFRASNPGVAAAEATFSSPIELIVKSISERSGKL